MALATSEDSSERESDAVIKLGNQFHATEVFLWDVASHGSLFYHVSKNHAPHWREFSDNSNHLDGCCSNRFGKLSECIGVDDLEFIEEKTEMGLPLSFKSSKKITPALTRRKKALKVTPSSSRKDPKHSECTSRFEVEKFATNTNVQHEDDLVYHEDECCTSRFNDVSSQGFGCKLSLQPLSIVIDSTSQFEVEKFVTSTSVQHEDDLVYDGDVAKGIFKQPNFNIQLPTDNVFNQNLKENISRVSDDTVNSDHEYCLGISMDDSWKRNLSDFKSENDTRLETSSEISGFITDSKIDAIDMKIAEPPCLDSLESIQHTVQAGDCINGSRCYGESESWTVGWDAFYMTNYYYNNITQESTWHPPLGFEHTANLSYTDEIPSDPFSSSFDLGNACDITEDKSEGKKQVIDIFSKSCGQNVDKSLNLSYHEKMSKLHQISTNSISDVTNVPESREKLVDILCSHVKILGDDFTMDPCDSLHFSDSQEYHERLESIHDNSSFEKMQSCFSPNFKDHENNGVCLETDESSDVMFSSPCNNSSGTCNGSVPGEELECLMPQKIVTSSKNAADVCCSLNVLKNEEKLTQVASNQGKASRKRNCALPEEMEGFSPDIIKYWVQRHSLFSKFDCGIKMDEEGWFSVTPEQIAKHHASRCGNGTVIDCFTCVGGNAIQFAMKNNHVIAIDIDPLKIEYAHYNATIYGVQNNIDFIKGDFLHLAANLKGDVIFMSPPWGGPDYLKAPLFDIKTMLKPQNGEYLLRIAKSIAPKIVMFLPRNVDVNQLAEMARLIDPSWELEVEKNFLNGKLKAITAYFTTQQK